MSSTLSRILLLALCGPHFAACTAVRQQLGQSLVSVETEIAIGEKIAAQSETQEKVLKNRRIQTYVRHWHQIVDNGNIHHAKYGAKVISFEDGYEGVRIYATKYCAKLESEGALKLDSFAGKYWGRSRNLPLAPIAEVVLSDDQDVEVKKPN